MPDRPSHSCFPCRAMSHLAATMEAAHAHKAGLLCAWLTFSDDGELTNHSFLKLMEDHTIIFDNKTVPSGEWEYYFDKDNDKGYYTISFSANPARPWKRHFLDQIDDNTFELRPPDSDVYKDSSGIWATEGSNQLKTVVHMSGRVVMKKVLKMKDLGSED